MAAALLALGTPGAAFAATPADGEPPPVTTAPAPTPDPAPPLPAPKSKPKPKPSPPPAPKPTRVYQAPTPVSHPRPSAPSRLRYTPRPARHRTKRVVHRVRRHKRQHKHVRPVITTPKVHAQVKGASVVKINHSPTAAVAATASDATRRSLVIAGIAIAALLFLLVVTIPATGARFTAPGRVLMDHQLDLVLMGVAVLLLTAALLAITGTG